MYIYRTFLILSQDSFIIRSFQYVLLELLKKSTYNMAEWAGASKFMIFFASGDTHIPGCIAACSIGLVYFVSDIS
jgi:hypothetical protein